MFQSRVTSNDVKFDGIGAGLLHVSERREGRCSARARHRRPPCALIFSSLQEGMPLARALLSSLSPLSPLSLWREFSLSFFFFFKFKVLEEFEILNFLKLAFPSVGLWFCGCGDGSVFRPAPERWMLLQVVSTPKCTNGENLVLLVL